MVEEYVDRASGMSEERMQYKRMMAAAKKRQPDAVLVWRYDRFARSTQALVNALKEFQSLGVDFISCQENIDTATPTGELIFRIMASLAQFESTLASQRVRVGMARAKAQARLKAAKELASEAPEVVLVVLFVLNNRPTAALGALVSDKINQWTLLVGMIPVVYALGAGRLTSFPLDARQHEEFFLTAAQSFFAVALLLRLRLSLTSAAVLLGLFSVQFTLAWMFEHEEVRSEQLLTEMGWLYIVLAIGLFWWNRAGLVQYIRVGLLARDELPAAATTDHLNS